jgi:hypothetical protein
MSQQLQITGGAKVRDLQDVIIGTSGVLSSLAFNVANGVPKLDVNGKILVSQLPNSVMEYQGTWNAATNTPTLVNGVGNQGDVYLCNVAGTTNFGAGPITFAVGDSAIYSGTIWQRAGGATGTVTSVGLTSTGNDAITITGSPITTSGNINLGFAGTNLQYINGAGDLTNFPTLITSIGLSMPSAFNVSNSPLTANGTIGVTGAGYPSQYIRGDGTLADFPTSGGGGSSVSYYLNGGTSQGVIGGITYYEMSKIADTGTGVDFPKTGNGLIVSFLTDAGDPAQLNIPAGNWNYEIYASMSSNGGTPQLYAELYVYDGTTFTLISTSSNEILYDGVNLNLYTFAMAVPATTLALTDRLAVKLYATNSGGKTTTVHTQDGHLCQIITTFSTGITALNGLTAQVQYFATGTSGTDFAINSSTATHTFNLPIASAANTGKLSSTDWSTFNNKQATISLTTTGTSGASTLIGNTLNIPQYQGVLTNPVTGTGLNGYVAFWNGSSSITGESNLFWDDTNNRLGLLTTTIGSTLQINGNAAIGYSASTTAPTNGLSVSGKVAINATIAAWINAFSVIQMGALTSIWNSDVNYSGFGNNIFYNGSFYKYLTSSFANKFEIGNGTFTWEGGPSGTAGDNVVFTEYMRLNAIGNLGIKTTTIGSRLQVNGNAAIGYSASTAAPTDGLVVNGNTLIGTTTDNGSKFQVSGAATFSSSVTLSSTSATPSYGSGSVGINLGYTNLQNVVGNQACYANNVFYDGSAWKSITSSVAYAQAVRLQNGNIDFHNAAVSSSGQTMSNWDTTDIRMRIANNGAVTINNLGTGAVTATSGVLSTTSDMNLKIEDGYIDTALDKILKLTPRYFYWKEETGLPTDLRQLGFYAQEVNEALGEEVANTPKDENQNWGIYDRGIIAMLTKAMQEQQALITSLQDRLDKIENK